jgi:hypothetical protein
VKPEPFPGLEYHRATAGALAQAAKAAEYEVFSGLGYPGPGPVIAEYDQYPSVFYVAVNEGQDVVGVVRKILAGPSGFTTLTHFDLGPEQSARARAIASSENCEEMATTAIKKGFRARHNFACVLSLFRLAYEDAVRNKVTWWFAPIEPLVLFHYRNVFHFAFEELAPAQDYLGAPTIPCLLNLDNGIERLRREDPELAAWFEEGLAKSGR